jgi:hypothetical protein
MTMMQHRDIFTAYVQDYPTLSESERDARWRAFADNCPTDEFAAIVCSDEARRFSARCQYERRFKYARSCADILQQCKRCDAYLWPDVYGTWPCTRICPQCGANNRAPKHHDASRGLFKALQRIGYIEANGNETPCCELCAQHYDKLAAEYARARPQPIVIAR